MAIPPTAFCTGVEHGARPRGTCRLNSIGRFVHATTLATNAILERKGVRVAFVTTKGFRSMLPLGRYARVEEDRFDIHFDAPAPPVAPADCFEVPERLDSHGRGDRVPSTRRQSRQVAAQIADAGVDAVAVCLLHSYANDGHERRVMEILRQALPEDTTIVGSCDIWPEVREYERATTTLMSAYVGPVMVRYLKELERAAGRVRHQGKGAGDGVGRGRHVRRPGRTPRRGDDRVRACRGSHLLQRYRRCLRCTRRGLLRHGGHHREGVS